MKNPRLCRGIFIAFHRRGRGAEERKAIIQHELQNARWTRRILTAQLGSEIGFIVMGQENKSRSVVASRKDAMYCKRQTFYLDKDELGQPMISEGRTVSLTFRNQPKVKTKNSSAAGVLQSLIQIEEGLAGLPQKHAMTRG